MKWPLGVMVVAILLGCGCNITPSEVEQAANATRKTERVRMQKGQDASQTMRDNLDKIEALKRGGGNVERP